MAFEESEQPASAGSDPASQARAFLEAAGVRGITITGDGESWRVGIGWNEHERFVVAFSEKNPNTPNDPLYLAEQALAALIRNEGPCPHASHETPAETPAPETDALWEPEPQQSQAELDVIAALEADFGAEMLAAEDEAEEIAGDDSQEAAADHAPEVVELVGPDELGADGLFDGSSAGVGEPESGAAESGAGLDVPDDGDQRETAGLAYPGIALTREYDDLGEFRNAVLAAITGRKVLLLDVAADPSRRSFLVEAFSEYQNTGALGLPISEQLAASYRDYMALQARDAQIAAHAQQLERLALGADWEALNLIRDHFEAGWP